MCGPLGTMGCGLLSIFGAVFMAALAILIGKDYDYLGEWFDLSKLEPGSDPTAVYAEQRAAAIHNCWAVGGIYLALAVVCGLGMVYHKLRRNI
ncbi:hypothetical protein ABBQ38_010940 [Trebouxia sp. C0009 RCD-2024]